MNTTSFEVKVRAEDKEKFLQKNKEFFGPTFRELEKSVGYHKNEERYAPYYAKDWSDEIILRTSVGVIFSNRLVDLLDDISYELNIDLKHISSYQPSDADEASGVWGYFKKQPE